MKQTLIVVSLLVVAGLVFVDVKGYQSLVSLRQQLSEVKQQAGEAREIAERESSSALAASRRADEAGTRAEIAAGGRKQAEAERNSAMNDAQAAQSRAQDAQARAQQAQTEVEQIRREREEELNRMEQALNKIAKTRRTPEGMVMLLPDSIFRFDFDKAALTERNRELLSRVAGVLLVSNSYGLGIHGYTDDVGTSEYNQQLSLRRAQAVADFLVQSGLDRGIISVKGFGKSSPRMEGTSDTARESNRRVEIAVVDTALKFSGEAPAK